MTARRALALVAALFALGTLVLGLLVAQRGPGALDMWATEVTGRLSETLLDVLLLPTEPYVLVPAIALIAGSCLYLRRRGDALLAVAGPVLAVSLNTWVLKPLFGRWKDGGLAYPSGHTVSLVSVLVLLVLLARPKVGAALAAVVLLGCATVGLVGAGYHYLTDVAGGGCFATFVVTGMGAVRTPRPVPTPSTG
ncbi:phosphatase PAP2 family protein [Amycolatopsis jiangsuensis]|uniref:Membrane-associated phospholipid phosphatase n=1 Tax=Amycolatopsis jiangsuensis TaxID=1181879 RepID=A0A840ITB8_9PSEU|nr:phosphatase PAP2 family protein [Amycolatopsis jiangsuensis]MBB4684705.1 membrane-associated phospholipid phosphatase [Amycolatopsis jiangsuensis]